MFSSSEESNLAIKIDLRWYQNLFNLFSNHLNGFLKVIFPQKSFLKMPIPHFTHKNLASDQFLHGAKLY